MALSSSGAVRELFYPPFSYLHGFGLIVGVAGEFLSNFHSARVLIPKDHIGADLADLCHWLASALDMIVCYGRQNDAKNGMLKVRGYSYPDFRVDDRTTLCPNNARSLWTERYSNRYGTALQPESGAESIASRSEVKRWRNTMPVTVRAARKSTAKCLAANLKKL